MFSMPPATAMSTSPARIICEAIATALRPDPQTMLIVVAGTSFGIPAPIAACRAGFCPRPAVRTQPSTTSSTSPSAISARSSAARTACAPSSVAATSLNCPPKLPTGVRSALTITASSITASSDGEHLIRALWASIRSIFDSAAVRGGAGGDVRSDTPYVSRGSHGRDEAVGPLADVESRRLIGDREGVSG
jgi:hypothetical protein